MLPSWLGTADSSVDDLDHKVVEKAGDQAVGFVQVPVTAASTSKPGNWGGLKTTEIPSLGACKEAWKKPSKAEFGTRIFEEVVPVVWPGT